MFTVGREFVLVFLLAMCCVAIYEPLRNVMRLGHVTLDHHLLLSCTNFSHSLDWVQLTTRFMSCKSLEAVATCTLQSTPIFCHHYYYPVHIFQKTLTHMHWDLRLKSKVVQYRGSIKVQGSLAVGWRGVQESLRVRWWKGDASPLFNDPLVIMNAP